MVRPRYLLPSESPANNDLLAILRLPAFQRYAASRAASSVSMSLLQAVILWHTYAISGSTLSLGLVGLAGFVAALISSLIGGVVVDAYDRRVVLTTSLLIRGLGSLAMLVAIAADSVSLALIYGLVVATGLASSFEFAAQQAMLPATVPRRLLMRALTTNSALNSVSSVTGPTLAGLLIAVGGVGHAYAAHTALVAISTTAVLALRVPMTSGAGRVRLAAIREGLVFVWKRPVLLGAMTLDMFAVMFGGARALLPVYAIDILHADALGYGILSAALEAGTVLMALILVALPHPTNAGRVLLISVAAFGLATILFGASHWLPLSIAAYALVGMADQVSMVMRQNTIQLNTPDALRGRVTAVNSVFISASNELGALESGLVATLTSAPFAVISGGVACLVVVALVAWRVPSLRKYQAVDQLLRHG
jgi:MFS family permease